MRWLRVGPGSPLRRAVGPVVRRTAGAWEWATTPWLVVLAVGRDGPGARRAVRESLPGSARVMWVTDADELGRDWPETWVVHRVAPELGPVTPDDVRAWESGSMRIRRVVVLAKDAAGPRDGAA